MHSSDFAFHVRLACLTRRMAAMLAALCLMLSMPAFGQEDEAEDAAAEDAEEELSGPVEEVIVTGSRLRRDTYTSVAPLQIISADVKREAGLIDAGTILQESTAAAGVQIDLTFNGFVLDDGPGTVTANLRGLGSSRTLVFAQRAAHGALRGGRRTQRARLGHRSRAHDRTVRPAARRRVFRVRIGCGRRRHQRHLAQGFRRLHVPGSTQLSIPQQRARVGVWRILGQEFRPRLRRHRCPVSGYGADHIRRSPLDRRLREALGDRPRRTHPPPGPVLPNEFWNAVG